MRDGSVCDARGCDLRATTVIAAVYRSWPSRGEMATWLVPAPKVYLCPNHERQVKERRIRPFRWKVVRDRLRESETRFPKMSRADYAEYNRRVRDVTLCGLESGEDFCVRETPMKASTQ